MFLFIWAAQAQVHNDTILFEDGSLYTGQISDSLFNGNGKMIYSDNTIYNGDWKNGKWEGQGELHFPDGDFYQGEFHENEFNGQGVYNYRDGARYEGQWKNGRFDGAGTMRYADGSTYTGEWKNDLKEGAGVLYDSSDSSLFKGYFHNDHYLTSDHEVYYDVVNGNTQTVSTSMDKEPEPDYELLIYSGFTGGFNQLLCINVAAGHSRGLFVGFCGGVTPVHKGKGKPSFEIENKETYDPETGEIVSIYSDKIVLVDWDEYMDEVISEKTYHKAQILVEAGWRWKRIALGGGLGVAIRQTIRNCMGGKGSPFKNGELYYREKISGVGLGYRLFSDICIKEFYENDSLYFRLGYGNGDGVFMGFGLNF